MNIQKKWIILISNIHNTTFISWFFFCLYDPSRSFIYHPKKYLFFIIFQSVSSTCRVSTFIMIDIYDIFNLSSLLISSWSLSIHNILNHYNNCLSILSSIRSPTHCILVHLMNCTPNKQLFSQKQWMIIYNIKYVQHWCNEVVYIMEEYRINNCGWPSSISPERTDC